MGKRKCNERPRLPHIEAPPRLITSSVTDAVDNEEETSAAVTGDGDDGGSDGAPAESTGDKAQDPSQGQEKTWGDVNGSPRASKRGGAKRAGPRDRERGGAANNRTLNTSAYGPASALLPTATVESMAGLRGCLGSWGARALGMMRLSSSE